MKDQPGIKLNAHPLYEGTFSVGVDKNFNRIEREEPAEKGALKISLNPFLIQTEERNYLFDAGIGDFAEGASTETIKNNLSKFGFTEYDITDIFVSHLHYDHIGGLAGRSSGYWELTFPEANIWISKKGWEKVINLEEYYDDEKTEFVHFLDAKANLQFLGEDEQPYPDIAIKKIGGHTEFSQMLLFNDGTRRYLMAGDVLATRGEVNRKFAAKYDFDAEQSMEVRKELTKKAYEEDITIMGYHDSHYPLFELSDYDETKGYSIKNIESNVPA